MSLSYQSYLEEIAKVVNNHEMSTPCSHSQSSGSDVVEEMLAREASDLDTETSSIKCGRIMEDQETAMLVKNNNVAPFFRSESDAGSNESISYRIRPQQDEIQYFRVGFQKANEATFKVWGTHSFLSFCVSQS